MADTERDARPEPIEYDGPPDYRVVGRHGVYPETSHDEIARFNFLAQMNRHLSTKVMPGVSEAFEARIEPKRKSAYETRHQVRKDLVKDPMFQWWSAMRRATMETRQQAGRWVTIRQAEDLNEKVRELTEGDARLVLNPDFKQPRSTAAIDHHCMPGPTIRNWRPAILPDPPIMMLAFLRPRAACWDVTMMAAESRSLNGFNRTCQISNLNEFSISAPG